MKSHKLAKISDRERKGLLQSRSGISHGKDPNALAVAILYAACLKEGEKVSQAQIAAAGDTSIVTLRKRFQDVGRYFHDLYL